MKRLGAKLGLAAAAISLFAASAFAAVILNEDGTGFVGKGDVQLAFGWNNAALQTNADGVTFTYDAVTTTGYDCEWYTGPTSNRKRHEVSHTASTPVLSSVARELRKNKLGDVTGFNLLGFGATTETGDPVPEVGDPCPGNPGNDAVVIAVDEESVTTGGLYVTHNNVSVLLQ